MIDRLTRIESAAAALSQRVASIGVSGMVVISFLTCLDITLRAAFNAPIKGLDEIVAMVMAIAVAATFASGAMRRVHINVDLIGALVGPAPRRWLAVFGAFLVLGMLTFVAWRITAFADQLAARGQTLMILPWPAAPFLWAASALIALGALAQLVVVAVTVRDAAYPGADSTARPGASLSIATAILTIALLIAVGHEFGAGAAILGRILPGDAFAQAGLGFLLLWLLILAFVPVAPAMGLVGMLGATLSVGYGPALDMLGSETAGYITNPNLAVLPLFLIMGSLASVGGLSDDIYRLAHAVFGPLRGGLALATIGGCAGFGALTGSSLATAVTIGRVAIPEMRGRGYTAGLATGCCAAGGTLGQIVPPSAVLVVYAILSEESIGRLFIAAIVPALIATALYLATVFILVRFRLEEAPAAGRWDGREIAAALRRCTTVFVLVGAVIGGIYGGIFTVNEAAAVGAGGAFVIALARGRLSGGAFWLVMGETTASTAMIYLLIMGAALFSFFIGAVGAADELTRVISGLGLPPLGVIAILLAVYIAFGAVMDSYAILVITVPIVTPMVVSLGYDKLWWGIIMLMVVETGLITPPFGINVFALKAISADVPMGTVFRGVMPFVGADLIRLAILTLFPALTLWLPLSMR
jgi:tripartite ATP-independent transporter DctM subunit